ncbi:MAG: hypothetical protein M3R25_04565 [Bacteroidota bacterium]|nr:hypothetical protein [Bacteroidota bacterium]
MDPSDPLSHEPVRPPEAEEAYKELDFTEFGHTLLSCPKCRHFISGKDINIEKTLAKCGHCDHVFSFDHDPATKKLIPAAVLPKGVEILKLRSELDIRLKWTETTSKGGKFFMAFFTIFWNLIVLPFAIGAILSGTWGILLFLSAHLAVGLGLLWNLATLYVNQTSISITKRQLRIRTTPLKSFLWKSKEIDIDTIEQFYVTRYVQSTTNDNPNYAYALYAIIDTGEKISLVRGMNRETQIYVEQEIERFLGIKNKKVPKESLR